MSCATCSIYCLPLQTNLEYYPPPQVLRIFLGHVGCDSQATKQTTEFTAKNAPRSMYLYSDSLSLNNSIIIRMRGPSISDLIRAGSLHKVTVH